MPQVMQDSGPVLVEFYVLPIEDRAASLKAGHYVGRDVEHVRITPPGGNHVWEGVVTDVHRQRYERQYDAWKKGQEEPDEGTSLREWPPISPAQIMTMKSLHIHTVEALAACSDGVMQRAGMGAMALREKARTYLKSAEDHGKVAEQMTAMRVEMEALRERTDQLEQENAKLKEGKRGPGRPRKDQGVEAA